MKQNWECDNCKVNKVITYRNRARRIRKFYFCLDCIGPRYCEICNKLYDLRDLERGLFKKCFNCRCERQKKISNRFMS